MSLSADDFRDLTRNFLRQLEEQTDPARTTRQSLIERGTMTSEGPEPGVRYIMWPEEFVDGARDLLTPEELQSVGQQKLETLAIDLADGLAYKLEDSLEGFGSSDRTFELEGYINQLGFQTDPKAMRLTVVREERTNPRSRRRKILKEQSEEERTFKEIGGDQPVFHDAAMDEALNDYVMQYVWRLEEDIGESRATLALLENMKGSLVDALERGSTEALAESGVDY